MTSWVPGETREARCPGALFSRDDCRFDVVVTNGRGYCTDLSLARGSPFPRQKGTTCVIESVGELHRRAFAT